MYKITFPAATLAATAAMYLPHHSATPVVERVHGMLIEYTELRRHYVLYIPRLSTPLIAEDSPEIVAVNAEPGTLERLRLIDFLTANNIQYGEIWDVSTITDREPEYV